MQILGHFILAQIAITVIWLSAGMLIRSIREIARIFKKTGFFVSFFILGILTSLSELSVAVNSTLEKAPQISAGNLVGASFVLLMFVIPLLAVIGRGIHLKKMLLARNLAFSLAVIALPSVIVLDGSVSWDEGLIILIAYTALLFSLFREKPSSHEEISMSEKKSVALWDITKVFIGATVIFGAGHILVSESVYFAELLHIPGSLIALFALSIGTNIPELAVGIRAVMDRETDIAFGDYVGSAVVNTAIFGLLAVLNGGFAIERGIFISSAILSMAGFSLLYIFARSRQHISRREGFILLSFYAAFLLVQAVNIVVFSQK